MSRVAVVGLGVMGSRIAAQLLSAGHEVVVWNRTPEKARPLVELGAEHAASPADTARGADAVIVMVSDAAALEAVVEGPDGLAAGLGPETTLIDMSTVGPDAVGWLEDALPPGTPQLDAPVLGSLLEAESGSLTIFVGGPVELLEQWTPLLTALGTVVHVGPLGAGQGAKLVANTALFEAVGVLGEALALAGRLGLGREAAYDVIATTPLAGQAERRRGAIESGEFPTRFRLSLARKDTDLVADKATGADLRLFEATRERFLEAERDDLGDADYSVVLARILSR
jgi:3-hydroxyisobutyrate dehydrogenase-like beta-hydroxyacid dehydrogenase